MKRLKKLFLAGLSFFLLLCAGAIISNANVNADQTSNGTDIVAYAQSQIGKHPYSEGGGVSRYSRNGMLYHPNNGDADCSSFAYFVYRHCGYRVPAFYGNAWALIGSVIGPKPVRASQTHAGSICQNPIHMVILEEKYHGPKTRIIEEGGYWNGGNKYRRNVNEGYLGKAFSPRPGDYYFYNPVKAFNYRAIRRNNLKSQCRYHKHHARRHLRVSQNKNKFTMKKHHKKAHKQYKNSNNPYASIIAELTQPNY